MSLTISEPIERFLFELDFYYIENMDGLRIDSYVIDVQKESLKFLHADGFRQIWAPESYGHHSESELRNCYTVINEEEKKEDKYNFPLLKDTIEIIRSTPIKFVMKPISEINPFLNGAYSGGLLS